jgi:hypothetical protein
MIGSSAGSCPPPSPGAPSGVARTGWIAELGGGDREPLIHSSA